MDGARRQRGIPEEEMFLRQPTNGAAPGAPGTPTVGPLRINKAASPPPRTGSAQSQNDSQNRPPPQLYPAPTSKPPTAPLPYPDDRQRPGPQAGSGRLYTPLSETERAQKNTTPEGQGQRRRRASSITQQPPLPLQQRARFEANDPNRPSVSGYAHAPLASINGRTGSPANMVGQQERRGTNSPFKPLPASPGPETPEKDDGLFAKPPKRAGTEPPGVGEQNPFPEYHQQYWPPPNAAANSTGGGHTLNIPNPKGVNRLDSTASTSTTRAQRGSPPPPETPIIPAGGGIEARYAAAGIAGTSTLGAIAAQNSAAALRTAHYPSPLPRMPGSSPPPQQQPQQQPPRRPWTPTEQPGSQPHGPPAVYQGQEELTPRNSTPSQVPVTLSDPQGPQSQFNLQGPPSSQPPNMLPSRVNSEVPLENDFQRMAVHDEPPPAYSSVHPAGPPGATNAQGYPLEKGQQNAPGGPPGAAAAAAATIAGVAPHINPDHNQHPAFASGPQQPQASSFRQNVPSPIQINPSPSPAQSLATTVGPGPASPPPLPEGWIAHLDPNSGQYYYIHLSTQSTQWEFPKGPTPLNLNEPLSPTGTFVNPLASPSTTTFSSKLPLASGALPVQQSANYRPETIFSMNSILSPQTPGFTGPPPSAGVDIYKVAPTNGVYFGPYLRYTNMDLERGCWLGSILLVTDSPQPPTIHIHQSSDLSPNPRQLKPNPIFSHQRWMFFRYDIDLQMEQEGTKWTYAITSHLGCTRYEFLVAGQHETNWRFIAHSGNDFALNVTANERSRLGGIGYMWKDILQKHIECNGFHVQLGLGDQIYADRLWKEIPLLKQWTAMSGKENRKNAPWTVKHEDDVTHAYFHYYTSHFDQPHLREAFAQIPHILTLDDHDIFDGFGSYPEYMQFSNMFKNIGRVGIEMYLLFQHHTTLEILRNVNNDQDLFTITGTGWHFIKYLGPSVVVVGPDCRSERNPHQVMAGPTYQGLFPKVAVLPPSVQHCIWMVPVPIIYPRLESVESLANTVAIGKKAATGTFNMLGKVTGSVAGIVGAKGMVGEGFNTVKKAVGKSGLMSGVLSPFGDVEMLDELRDQWTHESKDLERTYLIRTLQGIAHNKSLRMTFFSGDVNCCGAGLVHDPSHPQDHKTMYQIISSSVVNAPPSNYVLRLLHNNKPLYVPANGHRSTHQPSDTKEDMMEIFASDIDGKPREMKRLMGRRNYVACVAFDPEVVNGTFGQTSPGQGSGKLSLAVDFIVQNDSYGVPMKYGPVIVPSVEYGR